MYMLLEIPLFRFLEKLFDKLFFVLEFSFSLDLFAGNIFCSFVIIPFAYFYGEERGDYIDFIDSRTDDSACTRIANSVKYTILFIVFSIVCIFICLAMRPGNSFEKGKELEWAKKLFDVEKSGETAIFFTIAILNCLGALPWPLYSGYGLAVLPWELIKGKKSLAETKSEVLLFQNNIR